MDILSGSYSAPGLGAEEMAGHFQVLWGNPDGSFQKPTALKGTDGNILEINVPKELTKGDNSGWRISTRPTAVDWDADGDLDLIVGNFIGTFVLFTGKGNGDFSPKADVIMLHSSPLRLSAGGGHHSDPVVVDWDGDGDLDLISSSAFGGVQWAENKAGKGKPISLTYFTALLPARSDEEEKNAGSFWQGDLPKLGNNTRIWVQDVNGDGKLDITLGDDISKMSATKGLTLDQAKDKYLALVDEQEKRGDAFMKKKDFGKEAMEKINKEFRELQNQRETLISRSGTGHIWLYIQK